MSAAARSTIESVARPERTLCRVADAHLDPDPGPRRRHGWTPDAKVAPPLRRRPGNGHRRHPGRRPVLQPHRPASVRPGNRDGHRARVSSAQPYRHAGCRSPACDRGDGGHQHREPYPGYRSLYGWTPRPSGNLRPDQGALSVHAPRLGRVQSSRARHRRRRRDPHMTRGRAAIKTLVPIVLSLLLLATGTTDGQGGNGPSPTVSITAVSGYAGHAFVYAQV